MGYFKTFISSLALVAMASSFQGFAQTYRVKISSNPGGCPVYTEVYEYDFVDEKPEFPGGGNSMIDFVNATRKYPLEAYEAGIEGRVTCAFVVNVDGKISNIQVLRGVEPSLDREAMRIIAKMPDWSPGKINNRNVPVRVVRCIPFRK